MAHGLARDERQIQRRGMMPVCGKAVGVDKYGVLTAELLGTLVHHAAKGFHVAADVLGNGHSRIIAAGQQQPVKQIAQADMLAQG